MGWPSQPGRENGLGGPLGNKQILLNNNLSKDSPVESKSTTGQCRTKSGGNNGNSLRNSSDSLAFRVSTLEKPWFSRNNLGFRILVIRFLFACPPIFGGTDKISGCSSVVEHHVANVIVEGSIPFTRSFDLEYGTPSGVLFIFVGSGNR